MIMEGFVYSPFSTFSSFRSSLTPSRSGDSAVKQPSWKQGKSGIISPFLGGPLTPMPSDYLDSCRRAQLQALLSQMSPGLAPPLRRASTREAGVQEKEAAAGTTPQPQAAEDDSRHQQEGQAEAALPSTEAVFRRRAVFQFLEQKYGYFHCKECKTRWESAYVWCISGSNKVYFKQLCRKCQKAFNPYRVEAIQCQTCSKTRCSCPQKKRHIDVRRPHRQELCGRCKGKRLSCDSTYSFKYIV
ncbi:protein ZAR1-like isoform X2 [Pezoporus wallicus]|uniref:protein ZAR1-like isoform X2 n=1 Tax=Pezoporus wallicus TaxID=35540 RepID=UPI0025501A4C|nr:protein ZAR1-like isoform X2 [Pezoporus wallicus]XP_061314165.1 protein ZAR1-like isoform X2 [Pezoporus flaviventris]